MQENSNKVLVIGYGSIGSRHCSILASDGHKVALITQRRDCPFSCFENIKEGLVSFFPDAIVIANRTVDHKAALECILDLGYQGKILVEKPLFDRVSEDISKKDYSNVSVAYNLRFHPMIRRIRFLLETRRIYSMQVYVGQYLPTWRPGIDYRKCYSASRVQGGGALRDLSHELDLIQWIAGPWQKITALGGHVSPLEIDSDDLFCLLIETQECPAVSLQVNYLDRIPRREFIINAEDISIKADMISGRLSINEKTEIFQIERNFTYKKQIDAFLKGKKHEMCSYSNGLDIMNIIDAAEKASREKIWILKK
jgi:predicted dehydrogenase